MEFSTSRLQTIRPRCVLQRVGVLAKRSQWSAPHSTSRNNGAGTSPASKWLVSAAFSPGKSGAASSSAGIPDGAAPAAGLEPAADPPPPPGPGPRSAWVMLDGRPVLEIRAPAGAQTPEASANRATRELTALAVNPTISPEQKEINALMRKAEIHAAARLPRSGCPGSPGAAAVAAV